MMRLQELGPQISPTKLIHNILAAISPDVPADLICACSYRSDLNRIEPLAHYSRDPERVVDTAALQKLLQRFIRQSHAAVDSYVLNASELEPGEFKSALIFNISMQDQIIGVIGLLSRQPDVYGETFLEALAIPIYMLRTTIENLHLYEALAQNMVVSQSILLTAQSIAENPSPQHIVDVLCDYLFDSHITSCAILLYGPLREDRPNGPFEYLEMQGSWSKYRGHGIALGTKIYLKFYPELLQQLDERKPLVFNNVREFSAQLDPFARSLLRAERILALTILPLHASQRRLGVILVGTNKPHLFSQHELQNYQAVSEFLAISAMSQVLQQQHDFIEQGRAAVLDAVREGVVMVLPDARGARVLTVNQRFTGMFGVPEESAQGLLLQQLLDRMQIPEAVRRDLRTRWMSVPVRDLLTQQGEFHMIHSDAVPMDIEWHSGPVYQDNHVLGRIYTFYDVTAERTAVRVRSAFLSRVSHELRTPLTSIQGFAQFILEVTGDQLPPVAREYTEIILSSAKHLRVMFTDMIEMTRADAGELKLNRVNVHLPDLIIDAVARLELEYKARGQQVIMEMDDDLPSVHVDYDRIMQVISNLINNAIKYSPEAAAIQISVDLIDEAQALPPGAPADLTLPAVLVRVVDQGPGLSHEDIDQIFVPFFRTNWARTNKIEGTGLGLAVARSVIELHRGRIWAEPSDDKKPGGRFLFTIPISMEDA